MRQVLWVLRGPTQNSFPQRLMGSKRDRKLESILTNKYQVDIGSVQWESIIILSKLVSLPGLPLLLEVTFSFSCGPNPAKPPQVNPLKTWHSCLFPSTPNAAAQWRSPSLPAWTFTVNPWGSAHLHVCSLLGSIFHIHPSQ